MGLVVVKLMLHMKELVHYAVKARDGSNVYEG